RGSAAVGATGDDGSARGTSGRSATGKGMSIGGLLRDDTTTLDPIAGPPLQRRRLGPPRQGRHLGRELGEAAYRVGSPQRAHDARKRELAPGNLVPGDELHLEALLARADHSRPQPGPE